MCKMFRRYAPDARNGENQTENDSETRFPLNPKPYLWRPEPRKKSGRREITRFYAMRGEKPGSSSKSPVFPITQ